MVHLVVMQIAVLVLAYVVSTTQGDMSSTLTIDELYKSLQHTNWQLESLQQRFIDIENENYQKNKEIANLNHEMSAKNHVIEQLHQRVSVLEDAVAISRDSNVSESDFSTNVTSDTTLEGIDGRAHTYRIKKAMKDITIMTSRNILTRVSPVSSTIVFHAYMSKSIALNVDTTVVFNQELLDTGNAYTPEQGLYTVPVTGFYVVTWTMYSEQRTKYSTSLIVNGAAKGSLDVDSETVTDYHTATSIVPLQLNQGDHVYIRLEFISGTIYSNNDARSTFSGWLLDACCIAD